VAIFKKSSSLIIWNFWRFKPGHPKDKPFPLRTGSALYVIFVKVPRHDLQIIHTDKGDFNSRYSAWLRDNQNTTPLINVVKVMKGRQFSTFEKCAKAIFAYVWLELVINKRRVEGVIEDLMKARHMQWAVFPYPCNNEDPTDAIFNPLYLGGYVKYGHLQHMGVNRTAQTVETHAAARNISESIFSNPFMPPQELYESISRLPSIQVALWPPEMKCGLPGEILIRRLASEPKLAEIRGHFTEIVQGIAALVDEAPAGPSGDEEEESGAEAGEDAADYGRGGDGDGGAREDEDEEDDGRDDALKIAAAEI
jgi:hypothetical protein